MYGQSKGYNWYAQLSLGHGAGSRFCQGLVHGGYRRAAGRDAKKQEALEGRQRAAVERRGEGGAAGVGDLGAGEAEHLELR